MAFNRHFSAKATSTSANNVGFLLRCNVVHPWGTFRFDRGVKYMNLFNLLMIDWDPVAEGEEADGHYTIHSKGEVYEILESRVLAHQDELWKVYETPSGGIHAFLMSHCYTPEEGYDILTDMKGDTLYRDLSKQRGKWGVRISPKPKRVGDFVARYVATFGSGEALSEHLVTIGIHDSFLPN